MKHKYMSLQKVSVHGKTIGSGGHGKVIRVSDKTACKIIPNTLAGKRELQMTQRLQGVHSGIIALKDVLHDEDNIYMFLEQCRKCNVQKADEDAVKQYLRGTLDILCAVHDKGVVHHDIKPENMMQTVDLQLRMIDFGNSFYAKEELTSKKKLTPAFCAPETLRSCSDVKSDVWAVGVMAYLLLTREYLFTGPDVHSVLREVLNKDIKTPLATLSNKNEAAGDFVARLLSRSVDDRLSAREARDHVWLM